MGRDVGRIIQQNKGETVRGLFRRQALRVAMSIGLCALMICLMIYRFSALEPKAVTQAFQTLSYWAWFLAILATAVSFGAVGQYDVVIHRHFITKIPFSRARRAGICAIAVSQMMGLGVISGTILRWRLLPEIGLWQATKLTVSVAVSFLCALAMMTALATVVLPHAPFKALAATVLCFGVLIGLVSFFSPRFGRQRVPLPNLFTIAQLLALCFVDTLAAGLALYVLCPSSMDLTLSVLIPAFMVALGAGIVSGVPGGMGAFELTLLALLPTHPEAELLAAILAWRIVYFALPAIFGAGVALRGAGLSKIGSASPDPRLIAKANRAEVQILRQGEHCLSGSSETGHWVTGRTPHFLVGLFDPIEKNARAACGMKRLALNEGRLAVLYRVPGRTAALARHAGFHVTLLSREAILPLQTYRTNSPSRSGLRRKLRKANAAGIVIEGPESAQNWTALDRIAADWAHKHGGERGFSMGRYSQSYVRGQRLYTAVLNGVPIAFATFHEGQSEWVLDLMRHGAQIPDGTMHLLVHTAITEALSLGLKQLSLAAAPETAFGLSQRLLCLFERIKPDDGTGLAQFKASFAPHWERRYFCISNKFALPLAAWEIMRAIHYPPSLNPRSEMSPNDGAVPEYAFASTR